MRGALRREFKIVTPGIRLPDQSAQRSATDRDAARSHRRGADYIVVGRAVTEDPDPPAALERG